MLLSILMIKVIVGHFYVISKGKISGRVQLPCCQSNLQYPHIQECAVIDSLIESHRARFLFKLG